MAKQSYDKKKIAIKIWTQISPDADLQRVRRSCQKNQSIDKEPIDKGPIDQTNRIVISISIRVQTQNKTKGYSSSNKKDTFAPKQRNSPQGSSKQKWSNPTKYIYQTHRGALERELFEPPVDCCKYTPKKYKKTGKVYGKTTNPNTIRTL